MLRGEECGFRRSRAYSFGNCNRDSTAARCPFDSMGNVYYLTILLSLEMAGCSGLPFQESKCEHMDEMVSLLLFLRHRFKVPG